MLATAASATILGAEGRPITVEVHVGPGLPTFAVVGLPDATCREARDRVRAALSTSGYSWPQRRITVNLAPTTLRKAGTALDLPVAVALLAADGQIPPVPATGPALLGELGLDGSLRPVTGLLPLVAALPQAEVVVPAAGAAEAAVLGCPRVLAAGSLRHVVTGLAGRTPWAEVVVPPGAGSEGEAGDLADVRGQAVGRLAVEVAAAGGHHLLLVGPPGAGKTMLARRLVGLLPPLSREEALEVARTHSAAGLSLPRGVLDRRPPFRAPHHSASLVSLVGGGGQWLRPGELSCADHGVLFLDELGEFSSGVLDALRQPLEEGRVTVCRARASVTLPTRCQLVAATNPCPCGGDGAPGGCRCGSVARSRYTSRVSGPLLDRFDLRVGVDRADVGALLGGCGAPAGETTAVVSARVAAARLLAAARGVRVNADLPPEQLDELAPMSVAARRLLELRLREGRLSARGLHRVRRVARTVADLAGRGGTLGEEDVLTALALRVDPFGAPR